MRHGKINNGKITEQILLSIFTSFTKMKKDSLFCVLKRPQVVGQKILKLL